MHCVGVVALLNTSHEQETQAVHFNIVFYQVAESLRLLLAASR